MLKSSIGLLDLTKNSFIRNSFNRDNNVFIRKNKKHNTTVIKGNTLEINKTKKILLRTNKSRLGITDRLLNCFKCFIQIFIDNIMIQNIHITQDNFLDLLIYELKLPTMEKEINTKKRNAININSLANTNNKSSIIGINNQSSSVLTDTKNSILNSNVINLNEGTSKFITPMSKESKLIKDIRIDTNTNVKAIFERNFTKRTTSILRNKSHKDHNKEFIEEDILKNRIIINNPDSNDNKHNNNINYNILDSLTDISNVYNNKMMKKNTTPNLKFINIKRNSALIASLLKRIKAFDQFLKIYNISDIALKKASETIKFTIFRKGELLLKKGEVSKLFYGIIKGKANIVIHKEIKYINDNGESDEYKEIKRIPIKEGAIIGELGLIYNDTRSADVEADDDVSVFLVDKKCYETNFKKSFIQADKQRRIMLQSILPEINHLTQTKYRYIIKKMLFKYYEYKNIIYIQESLANKFIIVHKGECTHYIKKDKAKEINNLENNFIETDYFPILKSLHGSLNGLEIYSKNTDIFPNSKYESTLVCTSSYCITIEIEKETLKEINNDLPIKLRDLFLIKKENINQMIKHKNEVKNKKKLSLDNNNIFKANNISEEYKDIKINQIYENIRKDIRYEESLKLLNGLNLKKIKESKDIEELVNATGNRKISDKYSRNKRNFNLKSNKSVLKIDEEKRNIDILTKKDVNENKETNDFEKDRKNVLLNNTINSYWIHDKLDKKYFKTLDFNNNLINIGKNIEKKIIKEDDFTYYYKFYERSNTKNNYSLSPLKRKSLNFNITNDSRGDIMYKTISNEDNNTLKSIINLDKLSKFNNLINKKKPELDLNIINSNSIQNDLLTKSTKITQNTQKNERNTNRSTYSSVKFPANQSNKNIISKLIGMKSDTYKKYKDKKKKKLNAFKTSNFNTISKDSNSNVFVNNTKNQLSKHNFSLDYDNELNKLLSIRKNCNKEVHCHKIIDYWKHCEVKSNVTNNTTKNTNSSSNFYHSGSIKIPLLYNNMLK